jgi:hypothetical protein
MTSVQQGWACPVEPNDHAPLPALEKDGLIALYNRQTKSFGEFCAYDFLPFYGSFDECRLAMIEQLVTHLEASRRMSHQLASAIEHVKLVPTAPFPSDAIRQSDRQEEAVQEEAKAEEVKPKAELKRPRRNAN